MIARASIITCCRGRHQANPSRVSQVAGLQAGAPPATAAAGAERVVGRGEFRLAEVDNDDTGNGKEGAAIIIARVGAFSWTI